MKNKISDKRVFSVNRLISIELTFLILTTILWYILTRQLNLLVSDDYLIDIIIVVAALTMLLFRSPHPRLFWYGFSFVAIAALTNALGISLIMNFSSSLSIGMFLLGIINLTLFSSKKNLHD